MHSVPYTHWYSPLLELSLLQNVGIPLENAAMNYPCWYLSVLLFGGTVIYILLRKLSKRNFNIVAVGKIIHNKGFDRLARILKNLLQDGLKPHFYIIGAGEDKEETAAADFARAFLGAGVVNQVAAYPFESVYTSPTRLVMQDAYEAVRQLYHKYGFVKSEECDLHEDHIALEIQFLAHLSGRAAKLFEEGKEAEACDVLRLQKTFIETHIKNWVSRFCDDIRACPVSPFYKGWSYILEGFVFTLKGAIEDMLQECPS